MVERPPTPGTHLWRFPERECAVQIPDEVLRTMQSMAAWAEPRETGGTLVGHYSEDRRMAFVTDVLEAKTGARRQRTRFYRPPDDVDGQLARIYERSAGATHYLGEWHTHPGSDPDPSPTDLKTLRGLASSDSVATDTPILIILGGNRKATVLSCTLAEGSSRTQSGLYECRALPNTTDLAE